MVVDIILITVLSQLIFLPLIGACMYSIRKDRKRKELLLDEAITNLTVVSISKGRRRW